MKDALAVENVAANEIGQCCSHMTKALLLLEEVPMPPDLVRRLQRLARELDLAWEELKAEL